jgi:hypothetical protein
MRPLILSTVLLFAFACSSKPLGDTAVGEDFGADPDEEADADTDTDTDTDADGDTDTDTDTDADNEDNDGDRFTPAEGDCDDDDEDVYPGADETCNGIDDDCDDDIDEGLATETYYEDWDEDGYGDPDVDMDDCEQPDGYVANDEDCNDLDEDVYPGADEDSDDDIDSNCDGWMHDYLECADDEITEAIEEWVGDWLYWLEDVDCGTFWYDCNLVNQLMYTHVDEVEVTGTDDPMVFDVVAHMRLDLYGQMRTYDGGLGDCDMVVENVDAVYTGSVELDVDPGEIEADSSFVYTLTDTPSMMVEFEDYSDTEACNVETLDLLASVFGIDLVGFVDDAVAEGADDIADSIEDEIEIEFAYFMDCETE